MWFFKTDDSWAGLILRVALGGVIFAHGAQKLLGWFGGYGFEGTMGFFTQQMGFPWLVGFLVIIGESIGSLGLIAGFLTRFTAASFIVIMIGAIATVHGSDGFFMNWSGQQGGEGYEYHLLVIAMSAALMLIGGGKWSIDGLIAQYLGEPASAPAAEPRKSAYAARIGVIVLGLLTAASLGFAHEGGTDRMNATHMKVSGIVTKVHSGVTTVRTPWGTMTIAAALAPTALEVGERVEMQVNENNAVIDVHREGEGGYAHRFVTGDLVYRAADRKAIKLWTPEGEKTFGVQAGRSKMSLLEDGGPVTVELNEEGKVIDINRFTAGITMDTEGQGNRGYQIRVDGVVTRIKSGLVYVKTPVAQYTIPVKQAPRDAAIGDQVSLWLNDEAIVIDHHGMQKNKSGAHRFLTGKLIYADEKNIPGRAFKKEIKLLTPRGEMRFPMERMEVKTKPIAEGSDVLLELNEEGVVVDLRNAS